MSKRRPGTELTHDNWDDEEDSEEAGTFAQASKKVIEKREIKKAKRKGDTQSNGESSTTSVFKGFTGFAPTSASNAPLFSFKPTTASTSSTAPTGGSNNSSQQTSSEQTSKYLHQLKSLNLSVTKWISEHVDKNPYCILTPIFSDYEKHLTELEKKYPNHSKEKGSGEKKDDDKQKQTTDDKSGDKPSASVTSPPTAFTFGAAKSSAITTASDSTASSSIFGSFGSKATSSNSSTFAGFGVKTDGQAAVGGASGFSFAVKKPETNESTDTGANGDGQQEEEYVPPKNEVEAVKEDDAYYTKRCKLYYKKGESWADRGVGNLYLKKCEDKTVLLIRADTSLGNILLNILLTNAIPANRQGKNNVMLSCVPNPPIDEKNKDDKTPVSMLLRVKTGEDADEVFEKIKEAKETQDN